MIAELVTTVALLAESPSVAAASPSFWSSASRVSRIARRGARLAICLASPSWPPAPNQIRPSTSSARPGSKRAQPALRAELEERVGLQPRLLGLAVLAGAGGGLHAVERERDQVVVGLVGLLGPGFGGIAPFKRALGLRGDALDLLVRRHALLLLGRDPDEAAELGRAPRAAVSVRAGSRLASWSRRSAKAPTAPVRKATASLISKSRVTWSSLTPRPYSTGTSARNCSSCWARRAASSGVNGAAVKPCERLVGTVERGARDRRPASGSAANAADASRLGGRAAILGVARREDREVARGLRGGLGAARGEVLLDAAAGVVEQLAQPRLVGVEQVLAHGLRGRARRVLPRASWSSASVACAPGRVKRVAVRYSRSSSQRFAVAASPRAVASTVTA